MTTVNFPDLARSAAARMPFFWWRRETWLLQSGRTPSSARADDVYIPAGTADLWRSSRPQLVR